MSSVPTADTTRLRLGHGSKPGSLRVRRVHEHSKLDFVVPKHRHRVNNELASNATLSIRGWNPRMANMMDRKSRIDRILLPHNIRSLVHRLLRGLERKQRFHRDLTGHVLGERMEFLALDDVVDHAQTVRFVGGPDVRSEQEFLGFTRPEFKGVGEPFDAVDAHRDDGVLEGCVGGCDDDVEGPDEHEAAGDYFAVDLGDGGFGDVAPATAEA